MLPLEQAKNRLDQKSTSELIPAQIIIIVRNSQIINCSKVRATEEFRGELVQLGQSNQ